MLPLARKVAPFLLSATVALCWLPQPLASTITAWGDPSNLETQIPADLTNAVAVSAGYGHGLALLEDGTVRNWGGEYGGAGPVPAGLSNITAIACGGHHCLVLKQDGTLAAWKYYFDDYGQATVPAGLSNVVAIAAGGYHSLALKSDGTVVAFGRNLYPYPFYGESMVPPGMSNVVATAAGDSQSLALRSDGTATYWGSFYTLSAPFLAGRSNLVAVAAGYQHCLALQNDGTVLAWGSNAVGQTNVPPGLTGAVAIACGDSHSLALRRDGTVIAWGSNSYDQTNVPAGLTNVTAIACGGTFSVALAGEPLLRVIQQPRDIQSVVGDNAVFRCAVVGRPPLTLQWYFNETPLQGRTNEFLGITDVGPERVGSYHLVASNSLGSTQSTAAVLNLLPLAITSQPTNAAVYGGDSIAFSAQARNVGPFSYQWRRDGADLPGETGAQISLSNATTNDAGSYSVRVSNPYGDVVSSNAVLEVTPITLPSHPTNRIVYSGESTVFNVSAYKQGPFSFQWRFNGEDLPGRTNGPLTLTNVSPTAAGAYSVRVSNPYGTIESSNAVLTVLESAPVIESHPVGRFAWHLGSASLSVAATGSKPLSYQWLFSGVPIPVATNATLTLTGVTAGVSGSYSVLVNNYMGTSPSSNALLQVIPLACWGSAQGFQSAPAATNVAAIESGESYALALSSNDSVVAWGFYECPPLLPPGLSNVAAFSAGPVHTLALHTDGTVMAWGCSSNGKTDVPPGLSNVVAVAAGSSHSLALRSDGTVIAWGAAGSAPPPDLRSVVAIAAGRDSSVALKADGTLATWGPRMQGATNFPASLSNVVAIACGEDHALALRADGSVTSWGTALAYPNYGQTNVPAGLSNVVAIAGGTYHSLALKANGTVVCWGLGSSGQTNPPAGLSNVVAITAGYSHSIAQVNAGELAFARQPLDATVAQGQPALISAAGVSSQPLHYQWRFNGTDIPAATNSWLRIPAVQPADAGFYSLMVSNSFGTLASGQALLSVTDRPPVIVMPPSNAAALASVRVALTVTAEGSPPLQYQWRKDDAAIPGATSSVFSIPAPQRTNGGLYSVLVTNLFGMALSEPATLRIIVPQQLTITGSPPGEAAQVSSADSDGGSPGALDLPYFSVWASTNLVDWQLLPDALTLSNGRLWLEDFSATNYPSRFYRLSEALGP